MNDQDCEFLERVLGCIEADHLWRVYFRKGSVLLLSREDANTRNTPLYRPQKRYSKLGFCLARHLHGCFPRVGFLGKSFSFSENDASLVSQIESHLKTRVLSLLLGNPEQAQRRFLGLLEDFKGNGPAVFKAGFREEAREAVKAEREFLLKHGGRLPGVPRILLSLGDVVEDYDGFVLAWITGKTAKAEKALAHLPHWLGQDTQALREFPAWKEVAAQWQRAGLARRELKRVERLALTLTLVHGDYAPWNLLVDREDRLWALDWEAGEEGGLPALDWVHFLYQIEKHLRGRKFESLVRRVERRLRDPDSREFLNRVGWGEERAWLVLVYLATHWLITDEERPALLRKAAALLLP